MKFLPLLGILICLLQSCTPSAKIVKFTKKDNRVFANNNLKQFLRENPSPSIVLRVPNGSDKTAVNSLSTKDNNLLYNSIENEFLKAGLSVRDRVLFNDLIDRTGATDYSEIKNVTNTDLILEVINLDPAVLYTTNKVSIISKNRQTDVTQNMVFKKYGASLEFRLILMKTNEIAGTYKYNYQPCGNSGCPLDAFAVNGKGNTKQIVPKENVSINTLEDFVTDSVKDLIASFRAGN